MWEIFNGLLDFLGWVPPSRVTVADRYEMKKKIRELKRREANAIAQKREKAGEPADRAE